MAKKISIPEIVTDLNLEEMRKKVRNGNKHPGAIHILDSTNNKKFGANQ